MNLTLSDTHLGTGVDLQPVCRGAARVARREEGGPRTWVTHGGIAHRLGAPALRVTIHVQPKTGGYKGTSGPDLADNFII